MTKFAVLPAVEGVLTAAFNRPIHISHNENGEWGLARVQPRVLVRLGAFLGVVDGRYPAIQTTKDGIEVGTIMCLNRRASAEDCTMLNGWLRFWGAKLG